MRDSSNAPDLSGLLIFLVGSIVLNVGQFFIANDGFRNLEAQLVKKDQEISQKEKEISKLEGKLQGWIEGRR